MPLEHWMEVVLPWTKFMPDVIKPARKLTIKDRAMWTVTTLIIFLVASQIPLFGLADTTKGDPLQWMRAFLASNRGTLMELGIAPMITCSMLVQFIIAGGLVKFNQKDELQRQAVERIQRFFGLIFTIAQAFLYVFVFHMYGPIAELGLIRAVLIIVQLVIASFIVTLLDEMNSAGWGIASGTNLYIATNICTQIFWRMFSFNTVETSRGKEPEGAVYALFYLLVTRSNKFGALRDAFFRQNLPNLMSCIATVAIFAVVCWLSGFYVNLGLVHRQSGQRTSQRIKFFYTGNSPIMFQSAIYSNVYFISQLLYKFLGKNILTHITGIWTEIGDRQTVPTSGLAFLLTAPNSFLNALTHPIHSIIYAASVVLSCVVLSKVYISFNNSSAEDMADQINASGFSIAGASSNKILAYVTPYVNSAAVVSGFALGVIVVLSDFVGAVVPGSSILLAVTTISSVIDTIFKEYGTKLALGEN